MNFLNYLHFFLANFTSLIRILLNRKYSYQLNKFRSKSAFDCGGEKSKITSLTIFTSLTISTSLTIFTSLTVFNSSTIFTSVTIRTSLTILALVGNLDHQVAPLALIKKIHTTVSSAKKSYRKKNGVQRTSVYRYAPSKIVLKLKIWRTMRVLLLFLSASSLAQKKSVYY